VDDYLPLPPPGRAAAVFLNWMLKLTAVARKRRLKYPPDPACRSADGRLRGVSYDRRDLIMGLIEAGNGVVPGITRLQKFLFLLEREYDLHPADSADFEAYLLGPYSRKLYDDLQYLENVGLLESDALVMPDQDVTEMDFGFLASKSPRSTRTVSGEELVERGRFYIDAYEEAAEEGTSAAGGDLGPEQRYRLSEKGKKYLEGKLSGSDGAAVIRAGEDLKRRFRSLDDLIRYVYTRYPEYTTESEIREKIFGE
jgi:uncharacterized protein YwgA